MSRKFHIDKANGKLMGVCAGLANATGVDATIIRIGLVLITIAGAFPWTLLAYGIAAWVGQPKAGAIGPARYGRSGASTREVRDTMRDIDRRMAKVETFVTSSNGRLAREIDELR